MEILEYPNDILRQKATAIDKVTPELQELAKEMHKTLKENNGLGLAAPQIGQSIRLIVIDDGSGPLYMFNPVIMQKSSNVISYNEGCLSFPGQFRQLKRSDEIKMKYRDIHNKMQYLKASGLLSRIIQHECDHLDGKLFIDLEEVNG